MKTRDEGRKQIRVRGQTCPGGSAFLLSNRLRRWRTVEERGRRVSAQQVKEAHFERRSIPRQPMRSGHARRCLARHEPNEKPSCCGSSRGRSIQEEHGIQRWVSLRLASACACSRHAERARRSPGPAGQTFPRATTSVELWRSDDALEEATPRLQMADIIRQRMVARNLYVTSSAPSGLRW